MLNEAGSIKLPALQQPCMTFYCPLYPLRLNADVPLSHSCGTVLQEPLNKSNVIAVIFVNLRCVPFTEAVSAYSVIAEVVTDDGELLLYGSFRDGENQLILLYAITKAVVFYVHNLIDIYFCL